MYDRLVDTYGPERLFRDIDNVPRLRLAGRSSHFNGELRTALAVVEREFKHTIVGVMRDGAVALGAFGDGDKRWYRHARLLRESARRASSKQRSASLTRRRRFHRARNGREHS